MNPEKDAQDAYTAAVARAERSREEWERLGSPLLSVGSERQPVPHPPLKAINEVESLAERLRQPMLKRHRGPEPKAVMEPSPAGRVRQHNR